MLLPLPATRGGAVAGARPQGAQPGPQGREERADRVHGGRELVPEFYEVFARNMRDLGTPVYARRFFETILEEFPDTRGDLRGAHRHDADRRVADLPLAHGHRGALGVVAARASRHLPEHAALLDACCGGRSRSAAPPSTSADRRRTRARFTSRPSGAPTRHAVRVGVLAGVRRRAAGSEPGTTRSSRWRSRRGSGCRSGSRNRSDRTSCGDSVDALEVGVRQSEFSAKLRS